MSAPTGAEGSRSAPPGPGLVAGVVVPLPVGRVFDYAVPPALAGRLRPGQRVRVPFRGRTCWGVVVRIGGGERAGLAAVEAVLDPLPALTPALLALARWAAEETVSAWGEAVARALPPAGRLRTRSAQPGGAPVPDAPRTGDPGADAAASRGPGPADIPGDGRPVVAYGGGWGSLVEAAVARAAEAGGGVLVLAPEIEVARAWAARLEQSLRRPVAVVTSLDSPRARWEAWWRARRGAVRVAVGTRAATFFPIARLGLAVVLDEHDPAHKAATAPRWHARELALRRARLEGAGCVVASGAPSLESWVRARTGEAIAEETKGLGWPAVQRVDLRGLAAPGCLTPGLREAVHAALAAGRSALLVLNRLGYGRALGCRDCGAVRRCPRCRVALAYHLRGRLLVCRLCGGREPARSLCGRCRGRRLEPLGWGTERLEGEARAAFPGAPVARYDGTLDAREAAAVREAFRTGAVRVLVGTQMALRLLPAAPVGVAAVVLADATLALPHFRAAERTFQLTWLLAEGLPPEASLWLQSFYPEHPALEAVSTGVREAFYEREWAERRELGYPPARRLARLDLAGTDAARAAEELARQARAAGLAVLGPAALAAGRWQLVVTGGADLPRALAEVLAPLRGRRRTARLRLDLDVDPVEG